MVATPNTFVCNKQAAGVDKQTVGIPDRVCHIQVLPVGKLCLRCMARCPQRCCTHNVVFQALCMCRQVGSWYVTQSFGMGSAGVLGTAMCTAPATEAHPSIRSQTQVTPQPQVRLRGHTSNTVRHWSVVESSRGAHVPLMPAFCNIGRGKCIPVNTWWRPLICQCVMVGAISLAWPSRTDVRAHARVLSHARALSMQER